MLLKGFSIFSSGGHFVQPSTTILAYLVEGHPRNISMKLLENWSIGIGADIMLFLYIRIGKFKTIIPGHSVQIFKVSL